MKPQEDNKKITTKARKFESAKEKLGFYSFRGFSCLRG